MIFQEPMTSLNPVFPVGEQIAESIRLHQGKDARAARAEALRMLEQVRIPEARVGARPLSASALRRHAPARDDRDGAVVPPGAADRRRADDRARRDDPGADPDADPAAAGRDAHGGDVHHARHGRGRRSGRSRASSCIAARRSRKARPKRSSRAARTRTRERCSPRCRGSAAMRGDDVPRKFPLLRSAARRRGDRRATSRAARPPDAGAPLLRVRDLTTRFDVKSGFFGRVRRRVHAVEQVSFDLARRRDAGAGRRIGLRQVDDRPLAAAAGRHRGRQHRVRGPRHRASCRAASCARCAATSR